MRLSEMEMLRLLPEFMQEDGANTAFAAACDGEFTAANKKIASLSRWDRVGGMTHAVLDELAWELNIYWYDSAADIDVKRKVVKSSDEIFDKMGTSWAVETLLTTFYGEVKVQKWWEYGGEPHHFKIITSNPRILDNPERFYYLLNTVKRCSAWLDGVEVNISGNSKVYTDAAIIEHSHDVYNMTHIKKFQGG